MSKKKETKQAEPEVSTRIPTRVLYSSGMSSMMSSLEGQIAMRTQYQSKAGVRRILGFPVPSWQRGLVWTDEQCERFIQSVYKGVYLGLYVYNDALIVAPHLDGLLIDGQQRLYAIERYLTGDLAVEGPDGNKYRFTELTDEEKAHFYRMPMGFQVVSISTEEKLKEMYNLLNFGGTPHEASQRAV